MNRLVKKMFGGITIFKFPIQSRSGRIKLLLNNPDVQEIANIAYTEGRNDVLYANTNKTKETLLIALKEIL